METWEIKKKYDITSIDISLLIKLLIENKKLECEKYLKQHKHNFSLSAVSNIIDEINLTF